MKVLFLDRDGTLIAEPDDGKVDSLDKLQILPGVMDSLKKFINSGFRLVIVSNQPGLGGVSFSKGDFDRVQEYLINVFNNYGVYFDEVYFCPHLKDEGCNCRKPKTGLLDIFLNANVVDLHNSYVIGDRLSDVGLAKNIGCKSIAINLVGTSEADYRFDSWREIEKLILGLE